MQQFERDVARFSMWQAISFEVVTRNFVLLSQALPILHGGGCPNAIRPRGNQVAPSPESRMQLCLTFLLGERPFGQFCSTQNLGLSRPVKFDKGNSLPWKKL